MGSEMCIRDRGRARENVYLLLDAGPPVEVLCTREQHWMMDNMIVDCDGGVHLGLTQQERVGKVKMFICHSLQGPLLMCCVHGNRTG